MPVPSTHLFSASFQKNVPAEQLFTPDRSAAYLMDVLAFLTPGQSGGVFAWDGREIAP